MIAIDSNILIYYLEKHPEFFDKSYKLIRSFGPGSNAGVCSELVIAEIFSTQGVVSGLYNASFLHFVPVSREILEEAGKLRLTHNLKVIDSIHIASAIKSKATIFVTNDFKLAKAASSIILTKTLKEL